MFEKEGIKYALEETIGTECLSKPIEDFSFIDLADEQQEKAQCYKDGAEFGYNKAKEEMQAQIEELKKIEEEYYDFIQKKNEEDWKGDNIVGCLKLKIEQLEAQIKKMKCCENCAKNGHICVAEEMQGKLCGKNKVKWQLRR